MFTDGSEHYCCGDQVNAGDFVVFRATSVLNELTDAMEPALKVVVIMDDGSDGCTVGYLLKDIAADPEEMLEHADATAVVVELYEVSTVEELRRKSTCGYGVASFSFLTEVTEVKIEAADSGESNEL